MELIAIVLLLAPLFILGFFGSTDQDEYSSYGEILYRFIFQLFDAIWSFCMPPFETVLRLVSPASDSPLLADEDDIKEEGTAKGPSPRRRILRSLVAKTQQTMPPLVPIPGAQEKLPKRPNLKQSQPPTELEPAFLNPEDYPPGWLVYHPELGVVSKEEADAHDQNEATKFAEKETSEPSQIKQSDDKEEQKEVSKEAMASTTVEEISTNPITN